MNFHTIIVLLLEQYMETPVPLWDALRRVSKTNLVTRKIRHPSMLNEYSNELADKVILVPLPDQFDDFTNLKELCSDSGSSPVIAIGPSRRSELGHELAKLGIEDILQADSLNEHILERVFLYTVRHKRNEEKFKLGEANLHTLLESISKGIFGVDTEGFCIFVNPACVSMLGYQNSNEVLGRNMPQLIQQTWSENTDSLPKESLIQKAMSTGTTILSSNESLRKNNGDIIQVEYNVTPIKYKNRITGAIATLIDIEDRDEIGKRLKHADQNLEQLLEERIRHLKQSTEQYLHESEFNYALLNTIGALVVVLDTQGRIIRFNHTCEQVTGYSFAEVSGRKIWDIFLDPSEVYAVKQVFNNLVAGNFPNTFDNYWYTRSGEKRFISWSNTSLLDNAGNVEYVIASDIDITEKKATERVLNQTEDMYQILASNLPGIVYRTVIDGKKKTTYLNDMVLHMTGYHPDEISIGEVCGCDSIIHENDRQYVINAVTRAVQENRAYEIEYRIRRKDGEIRYFSDRGRPTTNKENQAFLEGVIFDITSKKETRQKEQQRLQELAHVNRLGAMGEMATEIAHELNQPLGSIVTYCDACTGLLKAEHIDMDAVKLALKGISGQAMRASEIIKGLWNFVGKHESFPSTTNISELIKSVIQLCEIEARANNVRIEPLFDLDLPEVLTEKILIEQVILNLLRNSIEALSGIHDRDRIIDIQASHENNEIVVTIKDTGTGLPFENPQDAFDTFMTTKSNGMGMGLPISKRIIEAHGGKLTVTSNSREGVTFQFTLPVETQKGLSA